jgi:DNA-binding response OmpR family regulator
MPKILIVEDQPEVRGLLRMTLEAEAFDVIEAGDGASGWDATLAHQPTLVLLDIMLPGTIDGLDLCRRIKADARTQRCKVVLVSARGHRNDMQIGLDAGADDYLLKPFNPLRVIEVVDALCGLPPH